MRRADRFRALAVAGGLAAAAALTASLCAAASAPATSPGPKTPAAPPTIVDRHYPLNRAGELKARLLERPKDSAAAAWAVEYASSPEVARLDPMTRAAERSWAARLGLAAAPSDSARKVLQGIVDSMANCPLDSVAIKRAAQGLTRIGIVVPLSGRYERFGKTFVNGLRVAMEEHNREWSPTLNLILHDSEADPLVGARKSRWLLKDHGVSLLVGEIFSANTAPLAAATQVLGAILISPSATNERLAILGDGVFQLHIGPTATAAALARQMAGESPHSSIAILAARTPDDSAQAIAVAKACDFSAVRVLGTQWVKEENADFTKPLQTLRGKRPTALVVIGSPRMVGNVGAQIRTAWPDARILGFQSLDPEGLNAEAIAGLEGATIFMDDYALEGAPRDSFQTRYVKAFREPPTRMSVRGYLTGLAIDRAIEAGCVTASQLREALRSQVYETPEGRTLRALRPVVPAFPERLVIRAGKAVPLEDAPVEP
ncbi:MAG TPA: ABC transporter substrate-binding protein [Candidatus Eisenbacteria bacterium]|nr:ABC transporter substrate-binding protein [Candidatus Eisenbacteria bacterium]